MAKHILITGGAGFIGSHLTDKLLSLGHRVRVLDLLVPQVHGPAARRPAYLDGDADLQIGDVRDAGAVRRALKGIDCVCHLPPDATVLLEAIIESPVEKLVVASSMRVYGEGLCRSARGELVPGPERTAAQLTARQWEPRTADGDSLSPVATPETKAPSPMSIEALTQYDQERKSLAVGQANGIPTVALRLFNVFGPRQALSNPYTGVLALFAARLLSDKPPMIFEDGLQQRDFVSVYDVAQAIRLALDTPAAAGQAINVGSGRASTVRDVAARVAAELGREDLEPEVTGNHRPGDIRHCFADITLARRVLGYQPMVMLEEGLGELAPWLEGQMATYRLAQPREEVDQPRRTDVATFCP
jgi:dTDP-L-rhamnose 4-epimerase